MLSPVLVACSKPVCWLCAPDGVLPCTDSPMEWGSPPPHQHYLTWDMLALPIGLWLAPSSFLLFFGLGHPFNYAPDLMHVREHNCRLPRLCHDWPQDKEAGLFSRVQAVRCSLFVASALILHLDPKKRIRGGSR